MAKEANDKAEKEIEKLLKIDHIQRKIISKIIDVTEEWFVTLPTPEKALSIDGMIEELAEAKLEAIGVSREIIHLSMDLTDVTKAKKIEDERFAQNDIVIQVCWEAKGKLLDIKRRVLVPVPSSPSRTSIASSTAITNASSGTTLARVKLPDIPLPKFNGNPRNYLDFRNLFESVIHNDESLSPIQKFYFLRGALVGEAESFLKGINIAGDQYDKTWKEFCNEFGKKRLIISSYLSDLFSISPIKNESGIRDLMNAVDVSVRGLKQCGEQTDTWSVLLSYLLSSKLDSKTRTDFENSLISNDNYPPYKKLREFLNIRAANSTKRDLERPMPERKSNEKKSVNVITLNKSKCCICQAPHLLIECPQFKQKSPVDRAKSVLQAKLCVNCFNRNHSSIECRRGGCDICGAKHHKLLHIERAESNAEKSDSSLSNPMSSEIQKSTFAMVNSATELQSKTIVLPSAVVNLSCGNYCGTARILLDSCSQLTIISDQFVSEQSLSTSPSVSSSIVGVGGSVDTTRQCKINLSSRFGTPASIDIFVKVVPASSFVYSIERLSIGTICDKLKLMTLADPAFSKPVVTIPTVNIIVGAQYYQRILGKQPKHKVVDGVEMFLSIFGWVIIGEVTDSR